MVLTPEELALFDHGLSLEENPQSACVAAMKFIQDRRGWVNDEAMAWLSKKLDVSLSDLESVATFYSLVFRKPVGKHVILMCDSVSCWIMGCETVGDHLRRRLGIDLGPDHTGSAVHLADHPLPRRLRRGAGDDGGRDSLRSADARAHRQDPRCL